MRSFSLSIVVLLAGALSGCCWLDGQCEVTAAENVPPPEDGKNAVTTPGCAAEAVRVDGEVVCASCEFANDPGLAADDICGIADTAFCETRENSLGNPCQLCVTAGDVILYDDCFSGQASREDAFCEDSAGITDAEVCTSCFDADGQTTSTRCAPRADECHSVEAGGRTCSECTSDGAVVSRSCDAVDIDPAVCRAYSNDRGSCVDCLDQQGVLLSHSCTPTGGAAVLLCSETISPEGLACTVCVDENGTPIDRFCDEVTVSRCEQLSFTEQTCIICLDEGDNLLAVDCVRNDCAVADALCRADADCATGEVCFDGSCVLPNNGENGNDPTPAPPGCEAPPACFMSVNEAGDTCRTCPFTDDTGAAQEETLCISTATLSCSVVLEGTGSGEPDAAPGLQGRSCVVCADRASGIEVYRDCEGNGNVLPPYCVDEQAADGSVCAVCYDAVANLPVYTSCSGSPDGETCFDLQSSTLNDRQGVPLEVDGAPATVSCKQCGAADVVEGTDALSGFTTSCALTNVCQDPYGSSFAQVCAATSTLVMKPSVCAEANPWSAWSPDASDTGTLQGVLAFTLDAHGIALGGARFVTAADPALCVDAAPGDCGCDNGARIELAVADADLAAVTLLFQR